MQLVVSQLLIVLNVILSETLQLYGKSRCLLFVIKERKISDNWAKLLIQTQKDEQRIIWDKTID